MELLKKTVCIYLIPFVKTGKDHTSLQSYLIITRQNKNGKQLEKVIAKTVSCHNE